MVVRASLSQTAAESLVRRHIQFAWWSLLCFLTLGVMLEALHGIKVSWYLKPAFQTRRLMWTLGHAHGTLLAIVHAVFGISLQFFAHEVARSHRWASASFIGASLLLPGGFFLGGVFMYGGDPGIGILLVPVGALLLFVAVLLTALAMTTDSRKAEQQFEDPAHWEAREKQMINLQARV